MSEVEATGTIPGAEHRYARWLGWGMRLGLGLLVVGFVSYVSGLVTPQVPIEHLPSLWGRPAAEFLSEAGIPAGWGWVGLAHRGDVVNLAGIALLASCSIACLAAVIPVFRARGERALVVICALQIAVLVLAASGVLATSH